MWNNLVIAYYRASAMKSGAHCMTVLLVRGVRVRLGSSSSSQVEKQLPDYTKIGSLHLMHTGASRDM